MENVNVINRFFHEAKIDTYEGSIEGLQRMILNVYGEKVSSIAIIASLRKFSIQYNIEVTLFVPLSKTWVSIHRHEIDN